MEEVMKLIEYTELAGFSLYPNGEKLRVTDGSDLKPEHKKLLSIYKDDILQVLEERQANLKEW